ncbi:VOC family protein [Nereida sp. MMG025]|uniref:VOC family protein n=1 Tax=Nereida sp. MMG025 TaxID=2909981 RepID=UPI001F45CF41|nr:VOC family protein [Nereida sp. MMG025]MCF6443911.1 VOC family protein [Nereida sp. MMG025]
MLALDHIAVACDPLEEGRIWAERHLGGALGPRGEHDHFATHNHLMGLGDLYFEVIATDPDATPKQSPRWFDIDNFSGPPRLTNWIVRTDDIDAALARLGPAYGAPVMLERGDFRWQMAVPSDGKLPFDNCAPAIIKWHGDLHPAPLLADQGHRLKSLTIVHPECAELERALGPLMSDDRVRFATGEAALQAVIDTPNGPVTL